ncbi:MAG: type I restriction-modification system subunit M, partial [Vibrio litoralis]
NVFNLNIPRYVDTFEEELEIDIVAVQAEITSLETELAEVRGKMAALLKDIVPNEAQSNTTEVAE